MKTLLPKIIVLLVQENFTEFYEDDIGKIKQNLLVREFCKSLKQKTWRIQKKIETLSYHV